MFMLRIMGLFAVIPIALLLTLSFFVLLSLRKVEQQGLKAFGYVIAALLWVGVVLLFSAGVYTVSTGRHPGIEMMHKMIKCKMQGMSLEMPQMLKGHRQMMKDKTQTMMQGQMDESMMKK